MACLDDIKKAAKKVFNSEEVDLIYKTLKRSRRSKADEGGDINKAMAEEVNNMSEELIRAMNIEKRNKALNIIALKRAYDHIDWYKSRNPKAGDAEAFKDLLVGIRQGGNSIGSRMKTKENVVIGGMNQVFTQKGLWPIVNKGILDREVAQEMWAFKNLKEGETVDGLKEGVSGSKEALEIAKVFHDAKSAVVKMQNDAGASIGNLPGHIMRQSHDATNIRKKGGKDGVIWKEDLNNSIDWELTAKGLPVKDRPEFINKLYLDFISGLHNVANGAESKFLGFKGPANLAKKISQERVLHFKTSDLWFDYNAKYGSGNVSESIMSGVEYGARNSALMEGLGTNPRAMFDHIREQLTQRNKENIPELKKISSQYQSADTLAWYIDEITGENRKSGGIALASIAANLKAIQTSSKLGGAVLSSIADMATIASQAKFNGITYLEGYEQIVKNLMEGRTSGEKREIADLIGVGLDGLMGQVMHRVGTNDHFSGYTNTLVQKMFKWTGMNWWTDSHKTGFALMLSRNMANQKGKGWDDLGFDFKNAISLYLRPEQWELLRSAPTTKADGQDYMTSKSAKMLTDDQIRGVIGQDASAFKVKRYREDLEITINNYFVDQAESAVPTPGAREQALLKAGTTSGTPLGIAMSFIAQFKGFPTTFLTKQIGKNFVNGNSQKMRVAQLVAMSTATGYMAMTLKDIFKNKTPRNIAEEPLKVFLAAFVQGGGLGIYGDFLFGEANRFGGSLQETIAGPVPGFLNDAYNIFFSDPKQAIVDFDSEKPSTEGSKFGERATKFIRANSPVVNWWWTKKAFDMLIWNSMQESMNRGYLDRVKNNMKKYNEQEFLIGEF